MGGSGKIISWHKGISAEVASQHVVEASNAEKDESLSQPRSTPRSPTHRDPRAQKLKNEANRRMENLMKLVAKRDQDQTDIRDRCDKIRAVRAQRFDRLLEHILSEDELKSNITNILREHDDDREYKKIQKFNEWNDRVFGRVQRQIDAHLNPTCRLTEQRLSGSKSVGFRIPGDTFRPKVGDDDPLKRSLTSTNEEDSLRRSFTDLEWPRKTKAQTKELGRSRPVLEPELWEQLKLQATPYGHFAQVTEDGGCLKTSLKTMDFCDTETDGIPVAGKRRTRWEHNNLGILAPGAVAGEGSKHRTREGGSSGALTQDHYRFERGRKVTDTEFPLGKRIFPHKH